MKKITAVICAITVLLSFAACGNSGEDQSGVQNQELPTQSESVQSANLTNEAESQETVPETFAETETEPISEEDDNLMKIEIEVGESVFSATLYDNAAAKELADMLPLSLDMSELNGNEKYYYLDNSLPTDSSRPSGINAGDIMLYGSNCLVLFYKSFSTSYSYTPLGYIDDPSGLADALGRGEIQVTFRKS